MATEEEDEEKKNNNRYNKNRLKVGENESWMGIKGSGVEEDG